ncbi:MAG: acyl carrier protein [Sulfuricella sp.]|nr:acyl carrier protein [Sulfuricella sp.]
MTNKNIFDSLTPIFREVLDSPSLVLTADLSASDVANWDSLNHITLIVEIEALTGLSLSTDELVSLQNVGDFVRLLFDKGYRG